MTQENVKIITAIVKYTISPDYYICAAEIISKTTSAMDTSDFHHAKFYENRICCYIQCTSCLKKIIFFC